MTAFQRLAKLLGDFPRWEVSLDVRCADRSLAMRARRRIDPRTEQAPAPLLQYLYFVLESELEDDGQIVNVLDELGSKMEAGEREIVPIARK